VHSALAQQSIDIAAEQPHSSARPVTSPLGQGSDPRSTRILAKSIYRELRHGGIDHEDVIALATELLALVADEMKAET